MTDIIRHDVNEGWAHSGIIEAGDFAFVGYCVGDSSQPLEEQINGAFNHLENRLKSIGLTLDSVVKMDAMFHDIWDIPVMEKIIKERFGGKYPVRKSVQTEFAHNGLKFQVDAIAYRK